MTGLDHTHDAAARSWLDGANGHADFPIQNLPLGVVSRAAVSEAPGAAIAIGDAALRLAPLAASGLLSGAAQDAAELAAAPTLNALMGAGRPAWRALRHGVFELLHTGAPAATQARLRECLLPLKDAQVHVPAQIGDYTDFYTSLHHARNVGRAIKPEDPDSLVSSNFRWLPIAYHGRASSVVISGTDFHRPMGQALAPGATEPVYGPCARLDFELEMGFFVGPGNALGRPVPLAEAPEHIFGMVLLNDWSARDHQFWEMTPLGPFLGKNFCTSLSPWIVTMEALAPFRLPQARAAGEPQPLAYLADEADRLSGRLDVRLSVALQTQAQRARGLPGDEIAATNFSHQYWTIAQMLAQHTVGGCNLRPGDLLGTGTVSGPGAGEAGAIIELSEGGRRPVPLPSTGEARTFLADGDAVVLRGHCERDGRARIGFGECRGAVLPVTGL